MATSLLQGTPYVPGQAQGFVHIGDRPTAASDILVVTPEQLAVLRGHPAGLLVIGGAPLSHPMIRLFALGIPTVVIRPDQLSLLQDGRPVVLDGASGRVLDSAGETVRRYAPEPPRAGSTVATRDGRQVALRASVADRAGAISALRAGAEAIGVVRSEFIMADSPSPPSSEAFERHLRALCEAVHPLPVRVRLLDIAADKRPRWLPDLPGMDSPIGLRGPRLYGVEPVRSAFEAQVRAVGRLVTHYGLSLMVPYLGRPEEFLYWRNRIESLLSVPVPIGVMAETPAGVLEMAEWLELADFVAIGCNDLMQAFLAVDRRIPEVAGLLDPYTPSVFRLLRQVAQTAADAVDQIQLDGLLPQVPGVLPLLLGIGYRTFSVEPLLIPYCAAVVAETDTMASEALVIGACASSDARSVRALIGLPPIAPWSIGAVAARGR